MTTVAGEIGSRSTDAEEAMRQFGEEISGIIERWRDHPGVRLRWSINRTFVDDPPILDPESGLLCRRQHPGPQSSIILTVTDLTRLDELPAAYYPSDGTPAKQA